MKLFELERDEYDKKLRQLVVELTKHVHGSVEQHKARNITLYGDDVIINVKPWDSPNVGNALIGNPSKDSAVVTIFTKNPDEYDEQYEKFIRKIVSSRSGEWADGGESSPRHSKFPTWREWWVKV